MADTFIDDLDWLPDELITSTKFNQWWANMQNFHNGTALGDGIIVTRHLDDANITSAKLAEAFFRGRKKVISTNSQPVDLTIQFGWDYQVGNGTTSLVKAITFPTAFSEPPMVFCNQMAAKTTASGAPDTTDDFTTGFGNATSCYPNTITASGFNLTAHSSGGNFGNTFNFGLQWLAVGPV